MSNDRSNSIKTAAAADATTTPIAGAAVDATTTTGTTAAVGVLHLYVWQFVHAWGNGCTRDLLTKHWLSLGDLTKIDQRTF